MKPSPRLSTALLAAGLLGAMGCGAPRQTAKVSIPTVSSDPASDARDLERRLEEEGPSAALYSRLAAARLAVGQPAAAATLVARALALDPDNTVALVVAARAASARGDQAAAARHYERAAATSKAPGSSLPDELEREWATSLLALAEERLAAGRPGDADAALRAMASRLPGPAASLSARRGRLALGIVEQFLRQGRGGPAEAALELARAAGVDASELRFGEARAAHLLGRGDKAAALFKTWAEADDPAVRWVRVAEHYEGADASQEALDAYRAGTRHPTATREALTAHGRLAILLEEPDEAEANLRRAAQLERDLPKRAAALAAGAEALRTAGMRAHALAMFEDAAALVPADAAIATAYAGYLGHLSQRDQLAFVLQRYREAAGGGAAVVRASAEQLVRAGAIDHAVKMLEAAAAAPGSDPGLWLDLARVLDRRRRLRAGRDVALERFESAVGDDPDHLVEVGRLWLDFQKLQRARQVVRRVLKLDPNHVEGRLLQADLLYAKGRRGDESRALEDLVDKAKNPALAAARVGERWQLRRRPKEALPWLRKALELAPPEARELRRRIHAALYEAYLTTRPSDESTAAAHMRAWLVEGTKETRADDLQALLTRSVGIGALVNLRVEVLEELVVLQPERPELREGLGRQLLRLKEHRRAVAVFKAMVERSDEPADDAQRIGRLFFDEGLLPEALAFYDRVEPARIEQPRVLRVLGEHLARRGQHERADAMFRLFLSRADDARHRSELMMFMRTATRLRRWELAQQAAQQVLARSEGNREAALVLGEAALALGEDDQAKEWLARAMTGPTPGQRAKAALSAAAVMERRGRLEMAAGAYEFAMDAGSFQEAQNAFEKLADVQRRRRDETGLLRAVQLLVGKTPHARDEVRAVKKAVTALELAGLQEHASRLIDSTLERRRNDRALLELALGSALARGDVERAVALVQRFAQAKGGTAREWDKAASILADAGHPQAALAVLESRLQGSRAEPELQLAYGQRLLTAGRYEDAEKAFMHALSQSFSARDVVAGVDAAYRAVGQYKRLRTFHARASALAPTRSEHTLALGKVALEAGDPGTARQAFTRHLALNERGHLEVANAWASAGFVDQALEHYRRAWEQSSPGQQALPLDKVVELLVSHGRAAEVEAIARRHLRRSRNEIKALEEVVVAFERAGDLRRAVQWSRRADDIQSRPERALERARLLLLLADVSAAQGELLSYVRAKAEEGADGRRLVRQPRRGGLQEAMTRAAALLMAHLQPEAAVALVKQVAGAYGSDPTLRVLTAWLQIESGDPADGLATLAGIGTQLRSVKVDVVKWLVRGLVERDRLDEAADLLGRSQVITWSKELAVLRLELLVRRGRWGLADEQAGELLVQGDAELATRAGWAAFDNGYYDLASRIVDHVMSDASGHVQRTHVMELAAALEALRDRAGTGEWPIVRVQSAWPTDDLQGAAEAQARLLHDAGDVRGAHEAALLGLRGAPGDADLLRLAISAAAQLPDGRAEVRAALAAFSSRLRPRARIVRDARGWLQAAGRWDLALDLLEELIALEPGSLMRRVAAVELALGAGRDELAVSHAEAALTLAGDEPRTALVLARVWVDWLEPRRARALLEPLTEWQGELAMERELVLARVAQLEGDVSARDAALARAIEAAPDRALARQQVATLLLEVARDPARALAVLDPLIAEGGAGPRHLALAARAAWRAGRLEEARRHLASLDRAQPGPWSRATLLRAAVAGGDIESVRALTSSLRVAGAYTSASPRVAIASLVTSAIESETAGWTVEGRGPLLELAGELVAEAAAVSSPGTTTPWFAALEELAGDVDGALAAYELAMVRDPTSPGHGNNLAYAMSRFDVALERALDLVRDTIVRTGRPVASYLDTEAWILHRLGRSEEALPIMRRVLALASDRQVAAPETMVELLYHLATIQEAVGQVAAAQTTWRDCARRAPATAYGAKCLKRYRQVVAPPRAGSVP